MANTVSAKKMVRKIEKRTLINKMRLNKIKTFIRKVNDAVASNDKEASLAAFRNAQPHIHRGVNKGIFKRNKAARILSRLSAKVKAVPQNQQ